MTRLVSPIYAQGERPRPTPSEAAERRRSLCAAIWRSLGLVVLDPADIGDDWLRQAVRNEAQKRYGGRSR